MEKGTLYIVATPIGNLKDITLRAIEVLKNADMILSEDTRETLKLLNELDIRNKPQISYRDQNHDRVIESIKRGLDEGKQYALVSDSGTPLISDPGFKLVRELTQNGYNVISIPGASALISAITLSGLPTDRFTFLGFLPRTESQVKKIIKQYAELDSTLIIYESPYRVAKTIKAIISVTGERKACLVNDVTKIYEKITRGTLDDLLNYTINSKLKGEFVLVVAKKDF